MAVRKNIIKESGDLPPLARFEILDKIKKIEGYRRDRDKALVSFLYLSGCRIEECCNYIIEKNPNRKVKRKDDEGKSISIYKPISERKLEGKSIQRKQIEAQRDFMIIRNVRCLKRRKKVFRSIPILNSNEDKPFIDIFLNYVNKLDEDDYLFPITRQAAYNILKKVGLFCHYLRHIRLTHLVTDYNFNEEHLMKFTGWADGRQSSTYVHLNVEDLINKMRGK